MPSWKKLIQSGSNAELASLQVTNNTTVSGSLNVEGSITSSNGLLVSGSSIFKNTLRPASGSKGVSLGTSEFPFSELFVESSSITIKSDVEGYDPTVITNRSGNLEISAGGLLLVEPGNSFIAETGSFQYISGSLKQVGDYIREGDTENTGSIKVTGDVSITNALTASGNIYPTTTGDDGQVIMTDGAGNLSFGDNIKYVSVKNVSGGTLYKGTPVHATGTTGNASDVIAASASNAATMPATFVLNEDLDDEEEGRAILTGLIQGIPTTGLEEGQVVYVGENGGWSGTKPQGGTNLIQNLGIVTKVHPSNGSGYVYGSGRSNDVPNLPENKVWVGSPTYTVTSSILTLDEINLTAEITGSLNIDNALTASGLNYPSSDGTADQVLSTDGNGNLSFNDISDLSVPSFLVFGQNDVLTGQTSPFEMKTTNGSQSTGWRMPVGGSVSHITLQFEVTSGGSAGRTITAELYKNNTATGKTLTVACSSDGITGGNGTITTETFNAGDRLTLYITHNNASLATGDHAGMLRILTTTA